MTVYFEKDYLRIANNLEPFYNIHPGSVMKDELEYLNISPNEAAENIGVDLQTVENVLNEKAPMTPELAMMFEAYIGVPADTMIAMQADYDYLAAKRNKTFMKKLEDIRRIAAVF